MLPTLICTLVFCASVTSFTLHTRRIQYSTIGRANGLHSSRISKKFVCQRTPLNDGKDDRIIGPSSRSATDIPVIAAAVAVTAFAFQIFGIFPWHARLQSGFESVKVVNEEVLREDARIRAKLNTIKRLQAEINSKMKLRE